MTDPIVTDVFKFVAIRPPQLATENGTQRTFIRDERASTQQGKAFLAQLGRSIARPTEALQRYLELDIGRLEPLANAYRELLRIFEQPVQAGPSPDPLSALELAGFGEAQQGETPQLTELAWDALYSAYKTGPDAGPRLEVPMAALRVLHFARLAHSAALADANAASEALQAKPIIPKQITEPTNPDSHMVAHVPAVRTENPPQTSRLHEFVQEIGATQHLLKMVKGTPVLLRPEVQDNRDQENGGHRVHNEITMMALPRFRDVVSGGVSASENKVLLYLGINPATSLTEAAHLLQKHTSLLIEEASARRSDPEFLNIVKTYNAQNGFLDVAKVLPPLALSTRDDPGSSPDVDMTGRIRPLGIGDLKVVKQTLLAYVPGEVAHIENVLKGESKERKHRDLDRTETTLFTSEETTEETERDTQTTDRFELKKEAENTIKEDMSVKAGVQVTGSYGMVSVTAHGDFAYSTSKQDSTKSSSNLAHDVVDRSISKVQKKTKIERTTKTIHETEEIDTHAVDNSKGDKHVVGIYRWVDKKYRAQVYNYGKRLMLEFIVPEPAAYFKASQIKSVAETIGATPPEPFLSLEKQALTVSDIKPDNYRIFAGRYNAAGIIPPFPEVTYVGAAFEQNGIDDGKTVSKSIKDIAIPDGYFLWYYRYSASVLWHNYPQFTLQIGTDSYMVENDEHTAKAGSKSGAPSPNPHISPLDNARGVLPVSIVGYDINAFTVNVEAVCSLTEEHFETWQLQTFDKIYTAYKALKTEYDQKVTQAQAQGMGIAIEGRNPTINLEIIKHELKKLSITMLTGQHFSQFHAMTDPSDQPTNLPEIDPYEALVEGRYIQFFEQAFEWEQMTYLFYPYFWGRKSNWIKLSNQSDPDPLFAQFLQAGAARVVIPVPLAYTDAIRYFLESNEKDVGQKIWQGGETPGIEDPLYQSIADEMRGQTDDLAGATAEGDPWEFTIPTTLVWLQEGPELPTFV